MVEFLEEAIREKERTPPYETIGLHANPFPGTPVPEEEPHFLFARDKIAKDVARIIVRGVLDHDPQHFVIIGKYGTGKSHILKYFKRTANARFFPSGEAVAVYVIHPGRNFSELYRNLILQFSPDFFSGIYNRLEHMETADESDGIRPAIISVLRATTDQNLRFTAWEWLQGQRLLRAQLRALGVGYGNDNADQQLETLESLLRIFQRTSPQSLVIFLDEFEELTTIRLDFQTTYLNHLRRLIDIGGEQLLLIISATPEGFDIIRRGQHALIRRLAAIQYVLDPLTTDETWELIQGYLKLEWIEDSEPTLIERDASDRLQEIAQGAVGSIIRVCHDLVEAARTGEHRSVTADMLESLVPQWIE